MKERKDLMKCNDPALNSIANFSYCTLIKESKFHKIKLKLALRIPFCGGMEKKGNKKKLVTYMLNFSFITQEKAKQRNRVGS